MNSENTNPANLAGPAGPVVLTISELTRKIRLLLATLGPVWVEGEISNYRGPSASGHTYFALKDDAAVLNAALFAGVRKTGAAAVLDLKDFRKVNGLKVRAYGEVSVFGARGQYQLVIRKIEPAGQGDLMLRFEELKEKLAAEGLFDPAKKKKLPFLPRRIGIVTSKTGAVIHDITRVLGRRFPALQIRLAPVKVQGEDAARQIARAVEFFNETCGAGSEWPADLLIVGRGGGSIEDLWAFNEEAVVRAVAASRIPVISAVGHETDFTLCDFAADLRAATPSAAAELAVPVQGELEDRVRLCGRRLSAMLERRLETLRARLRAARDAGPLRRPQTIVEGRAQRVDALAARLERAAGQAAAAARRRAADAESRLSLLRERRLSRIRARVEADGDALARAAGLRLERLRARIGETARQMELLSPLAVLERGYSLTRSEKDGRLIRSAAELLPGEGLVTRLRDGEVLSEVKEIVKRKGD